MKKVLSIVLLLCILVCQSIAGFAAQEGGYEYEITDNEVTLIKAKVDSYSEVDVPSSFGGCPLIHIGSKAFSDNYNITSVKIPDGVKSIGQSAFDKCTSLETVELPDSVISISGSVFNGSALYKNESNWVDKVLYVNNHLIKMNTKFEGDYIIKDGILTIADSAFERCSKLTSVKLPTSLKNIGNKAFYNCKLLTSIEIPANVERIGDNVFYGTNISDIYYAGNKADWDKIEIGESNDALKDITIHLADGSTYSDESEPSDGIVVKVNGKSVEFDQPPVLENGRTLVPLRAIFEALGATVGWDDATQTVTAQKTSVEISLQIGSNQMQVNNDVKELDVSAKLVNGRTLVPVRAISEAFGCNVQWIDETQTVVITQ